MRKAAQNLRRGRPAIVASTINSYINCAKHGYTVVRTLLGLLLLLAAALKGHALATEPLVTEGLLGSRPVMIILVEIELAFGLWLLSGLEPRRTWWAAVILFAGFACVSLYKALSGYAECSCFGQLKASPWHAFTLDIVSTLALLRWRPRELSQFFPRKRTSGFPVGETRSAAFSVAQALPVMIIWLTVSAPAVVAMTMYQPALIGDDGVIISNTTNSLVYLEPWSWKGKRFPLLDHIDIGDQIGEGDWKLVLYKRNCSKCQTLLENLEGTIGRRSHWRVAVVEIPPYGGLFNQHVVEGVRVAQGRLSNSYEWFVRVPVLLTLQDGQVVE